ncbi:hypothetical protein [Pseudoclavibacter terrae]|uniref:hypothetical protein n=1 Tax=Pseudoclavibacter terrae TaxID=1530195 RepID=UPI00232C319B|nr:hypothetical protein [Pseudoclavibacter terrae]
MRIGVRVSEDEVSAVGVLGDGRLLSAGARSPLGFVASVATAIAELQHAGGERISSVVFDVSEVLALDAGANVTSVLIEPRSPLEPRTHFWAAEDIPVRVEALRGGHNALGHELVELSTAELHRLVDRVPAGAQIVVSAAGSPVNAEHERRTAAAFRARSSPASVVESSSFSSDSLLSREFTAVVNSLLLTSAEVLASGLADAVATLPDDTVRAFVTTNDGGCTPLSRLPITPIHSFRSQPSVSLSGAATIVGRSEGWIVIARESGVVIGEFIDGLPAMLNRTDLPGGASLASSAARVVPLTEVLLAGSATPTATVLVPGGERALAPFGLAPTAVTGEDLVAVGAAVAPMSYWHHSATTALDAASMNRALQHGETVARANLVAAGAEPAGVRIAESRVLSTAYGETHMVRIRVRGVAQTAKPGLDAYPVPEGSRTPIAGTVPSLGGGA